MGSAASIDSIPKNAAKLFRDAIEWNKSLNESCKNEGSYDSNILQYIKEEIIPKIEKNSEIVSEKTGSIKNISNNFENLDYFMDSTYTREWLSKNESDIVYDYFKSLGQTLREQIVKFQASSADIKYPLSTITYGARRGLDGALALDRWGSFHESWCKVEEPTDLVVNLANKLRERFSLPEHALNSVVVNYYWDGTTTYIPAHMDTVACLEENSKVYCLSLGATREFVLCSVNDLGKYKKEDMNIQEVWSVEHGDVFALGTQTNSAFCHAVPRDTSITNLRISIIFRTVTKSFINFEAESKSVEYASGRVKEFKAECILSSSLLDQGSRVHIADLIEARELKKRQKRDRQLQMKSTTPSNTKESILEINQSVLMKTTETKEQVTTVSEKRTLTVSPSVDALLKSSVKTSAEGSTRLSNSHNQIRSHTASRVHLELASEQMDALKHFHAEDTTDSNICSRTTSRARLQLASEQEDALKYFQGEGSTVPFTSSASMVQSQPELILSTDSECASCSITQPLVHEEGIIDSVTNSQEAFILVST